MSGRGTTKILDMRKNEVLELLGRGVPAEEVAKKMGVSRRSLFYWLRKQGITIKQLQEEYKARKEERERARKEQLAQLGAIPDYDEFIRLERVKGFYDWLRARNVTIAEDIVRTIHRVCNELNIHPLMLLEDEGKKKLTSLLATLKDRGYAKQTLESYKAHLRLWYKYNEQAPPPVLALERYKSKIAHLAWFDVEERFKILRCAKEILDEGEFDKVRGALMFLFYTGSRAEALTNVRFEERKIRVNGKELNVIIAVTREKGRHGKKQWEKPIKFEVFKYIKGRLPFAEKEVRWLRRVLKRIYERVLDKESVKYEYAMKHSLHIWRHTAAMTLLHATDWNIGLVAEILGWENPEILFQIYGRMPPEKKVAIVYGVEYEKPKFEFLYGELEEKAKRLGLL